jgi:pimeloyl-ACP methyl ester carboxylesterase
MNKVISKDGTIIAYNKIGNGPALILVDGAMCNSTFGPMPKLIPLLSKNFTVICYDRRGRGISTDNMPYSPEREIEDIEALINTVNGSVYLFGMSSGALLSLMTAANNLHIEKIALYEPPFEPDDNKSTHDSKDHFAEIKDLLKSDNQNGAVKYFMREIVRMPSFVITIMSLLPMWKKMIANVNSLPYDLEITKTFTLQNLKSQTISTPAIVIYGGKSPQKLQSAAKAASDRITNSKIRILEGQTHNVSMKILAPVLMDFLMTE